MVNDGCSAARRIEPLLYLFRGENEVLNLFHVEHLPDGISLAVRRWSYGGDGIEYGPGGDVVACCRLEQYHFTFCVSLQHSANY